MKHVPSPKTLTYHLTQQDMFDALHQWVADIDQDFNTEGVVVLKWNEKKGTFSAKVHVPK